MLRACWRAAALILALAAAAPALNVKVLSIDREACRIELLLPMHHAILTVEYPSEATPRVHEAAFYVARLAAGRIGTTQRNALVIELPGQKPAAYRLVKVQFLERPAVAPPR